LENAAFDGRSLFVGHTDCKPLTAKTVASARIGSSYLYEHEMNKFDSAAVVASGDNPMSSRHLPTSIQALSEGTVFVVMGALSRYTVDGVVLVSQIERPFLVQRKERG
jgi:hypothetical protein